MTADVVIPNPHPAIGSRAFLAHRPHFLGLDGMRGVAAFAVMLFHEFLIFPGVGKPLPAAVAVDLFFLLSGFVLAYAYGDKLDRGMGWAEFMGARLIRLYPMILLGVSLGAIVAFTKQAVQGQTGPGTDIIDLVGTLLMLPMALRFVAAQFPFDSPQAFLFDAPIWSLFFEIAASAAFGIWAVRHLKRGLLVAALIVAGAGLIAMSLWFQNLTVLGTRGLIAFPGGFLRVFVSFTLGVVMFRTGLYRRLPTVPTTALAIVLAVVLVAPPLVSVPVELVCVLLLFPLAVGFGAQLELSPREARLCGQLGRLSYPVYVLHMPLSQIVGYVVKQRFPDPRLLIAASIAATVIASWLAVKYYDEPVRRRLRSLLARREARKRLAAA